MVKFQKIMLIPVLIVAICCFLVTPVVAASVPIQYYKNGQQSVKNLDKQKINAIIQKNFNLEADESPYSKVALDVRYNDEGKPDYLLVDLLDKKILKYETVRINLHSNYQVDNIVRNYIMTENDEVKKSETEYKEECPDETMDIVFYLTDTNFTTSVEAIKDVRAKADQAGYKYVEYYDNQVTEAMFKNWVSCKNLKLMAGFAHGSPNGISLADNRLTPAYFNSLGSDYMSDMVLYTVSCQVVSLDCLKLLSSNSTIRTNSSLNSIPSCTVQDMVLNRSIIVSPFSS